MNTRSKVRKLWIRLITKLNSMVGLSIGRVIRKNICSGLAPSIIAHS